jgi:putative chitinase
MTELLALAQLQRLWPRGNARVSGLVEGIAATAPGVFAKYGIATPLTVAVLFGQFSEECGAGTEMVENINYSAARACQVWPNRFAGAEDCYRKVGAHRGDPDFPRKLMDCVYGGRMGNRPGTRDGSTYIGRGLSQVTGRKGYQKLALKTGLPLLDDFSLVTSPQHALECGVADFILCGCLPFAEKGDVISTTRHLNGGLIGLADRQAWTARWKRELGVP